MGDLVLKAQGEGRDTFLGVTLPNITGQKYVFGPTYSGEREGEEFIFYKNGKGLLDPTNRTIISVDDQGQFWIQKGALVNEDWVNVVEKRRLKSGDVIYLGDRDPETHLGFWRRLISWFKAVKEAIFGASPLQITNENGISVTVTDSPQDNNLDRVIGISGNNPIEGSDPDGESENEALCKAITGLDIDKASDCPLDNALILEKIISYLPLKDVKNVCLVSKKWKAEANRALEKRGKVFFSFSVIDYDNPENSIRVFRYLHEVRDLKIMNLSITLFPPSSSSSVWKKMLDDLQKLMKSANNFSSLFLRPGFEEVENFPFISTIFQELGGKLVELTLDGRGFLNLNFLPEVVPPFPLMPNLRKFTHDGFVIGDENDKNKWASLLVPLCSRSLTDFSCNDNMAAPYLQAFLTHGMPKLRGLGIGGPRPYLPHLLALKNPLTSLKIDLYPDKEEAGVIQKLLLKLSPSLQTLVVRFGHGLLHNEISDVRLPSFPKLEELELGYDRKTRISWESDLDYKKHFPSLRKIKVWTRSTWMEDDAVFNTFFPEEGELRSETVKEVSVPVLSRHDSCVPERCFKPRMSQIKIMFPNAEKFNFFK